jgi:WD40 repeat protein
MRRALERHAELATGSGSFRQLLLLWAGTLLIAVPGSCGGREPVPHGKWAEPRVLRGHSAQIRALALSADAKVLASGDRTGTLMLWGAATGKRLAVWRAHDLSVLCLCFSSDGKFLASGGRDDVIADNVVAIWDARTGRGVAKLKPEQNMVLSVAFSPDGRALASGGKDGTIQLWDLATRRRRSILRTDGGRARRLAFSPDGGSLVAVYNTIDRDGRTLSSTVKLWNLETARVQFALPDIDARSVAFFPDTDTVATGGSDGQVLLWAASNGKQRDRAGRDPRALHFAFASDGRTLLSAGSGGVMLWDLRDRSQQLLDPSLLAYSAIAVSPDGKVLAGACADYNLQDPCVIKVWQVTCAGPGVRD